MGCGRCETRATIALGSNNWAVAGALTPTAARSLANDMHLDMRVPNTWYRAPLEWPDQRRPARRSASSASRCPACRRSSSAATPTSPGDSPTPTPTGATSCCSRSIRDADALPHARRLADVRDATTKDRGRRRRRRARDGDVDDLGTGAGAGLIAAGRAPSAGSRTRPSAWRAASRRSRPRGRSTRRSTRQRLGTPGQNIVVAPIARAASAGPSTAQSRGATASTAGCPRRGPTARAAGTAGSNGRSIRASSIPRAGASGPPTPASSDGEMLAKLGDGSYEVGSRAPIIRDRLMAHERFTPADLLDIQLDTRADVPRALARPDPANADASAVGGTTAARGFASSSSASWDGTRRPDSVGYRLTRMFREQVSDRRDRFVLAECYEADATFDHTRSAPPRGPDLEARDRAADAPARSAVRHVGRAAAAAVDAIDRADQASRAISASARGPSTTSPPIGIHCRLAIPLSGAGWTCRRAAARRPVHAARALGLAGASERMVVSPGREAEGIMHMPTGQSGHPLSPFYANSHDAWVKGEPTPFLPGPARHTLSLAP